MSGDVHTPTGAGPDASSFGTGAGAAGVEAAPQGRPELQVGAAFAGGVVVALIVKRLRARD